MKNITYKKNALLIWSILILFFVALLFKNHRNEVVSKKPVLIHEAGSLYKISNQVYYRRSVDGLDYYDLTGIDLETFQYVNDVYVKDKNNIWNLAATKLYCYPVRLILNPVVDLDTFSIFATSSYLAKDKIGMIYYDDRLNSLSSSTTYLGFDYYRDGNQIFKYIGYNNILSPIGVPEEARPVSTNYLIDSKNVYDTNGVYHEKDVVPVVIGADPVSFRELSYGYSLDKNNVYFNSKIVPSADPLSFNKVNNQNRRDEQCGFSYWKDARGVFLKGKLIPLADPNTFKVIQYEGRNCYGVQYSIDKNHVFFNDNILEGIDMSTLVYKGETRIADSENIYVGGVKCGATSLVIEDKELGYRLNIPKKWNYVFEHQYGMDRIFDCANNDGFYISRGSDTVEQYDKELLGINQFIPNAVIRGWTFESEFGEGTMYKYQLSFPREDITFVIRGGEPIENFSFLSSLTPLNGIPQQLI